MWEAFHPQYSPPVVHHNPRVHSDLCGIDRRTNKNWLSSCYLKHWCWHLFRTCWWVIFNFGIQLRFLLEERVCVGEWYTENIWKGSWGKDDCGSQKWGSMILVSSELMNLEVFICLVGKVKRWCFIAKAIRIRFWSSLGYWNFLETFKINPSYL